MKKMDRCIRKVMIKAGVFCVVFFAFAKAYSQQSPQAYLTKEAAISQMLTNNFGIQIANKQLEIAENNTDILNSGYLPSLNAAGGINYDNTSSNTDFNGALDNDGNPRPDITINDAETTAYNAALNLNYTLFDGLGRYYNFKQLKEQYSLTELQARETIENTTVQLLSVYYEVARQVENLTVLEQSLQISRDRAVRAQYQFEYGQANKLAVLNAEVDITTDSVSVLTARQNLANAQRDLNLVIGRELEEVATIDTTVVFTNELSMANYVKDAASTNVQLLQGASELQISEYQIKSAKSAQLPTVGLTGSYGWNLTNNPASAFFPSTTRTANTLAIGANLNWNLFDGGAAIIGLRNAKILKESQELLQKQLEQQVYRDIQNAEGTYQNSVRIFELQQQNLETNQNNFERSREQFKLGQITSIEYRQAQLNLLNAQVNKNAAKYTAKLAEIQLLQLTGQLLNVPL
jgi:outer membrane protein TolC